MECELDRWRAEWDAAQAPGDPLGETGAPPDGLTVFFGGGTPGLLATPDLARLCEAVRRRAPAPITEWTVEMAPSTVKEDKIRAILDAGVTRISLGVQSFNERLLDALGRRHSPAVIRRAFDAIRAAGCDNLNLDLIFATPGQTLEDWRPDLAEAIALRPEHLSTYCLTFEEDTKLWVKLTQGELRRDVAGEADLYRFTWETLNQAGFPQYEVSNFARPGFACEHNLATWRMGAWRGAGPSAASQWRGTRWSNPADLDQWLSALDAPPETPLRHAESVTPLNPEILAADALIFGLRLNEGVDPAELRRRFPSAPWDAFEQTHEQLTTEGLMTAGDERWRLTDAGRLVADSVAGLFLEAV